MFFDGLLEIGAVYAVVGADCRRDILVTEQHLDDFRVFARLEQHARIGVPQGVKVELVRCQSVLMHKALEYRLCAGVYEYSDEFKDSFKDKTELIKYLHVPIDEKILEEAHKVFKLKNRIAVGAK